MCSRTCTAFALLWLVALVGWPENRITLVASGGIWLGAGRNTWHVTYLHRDASLRVLWDELTE